MTKNHQFYGQTEGKEDYVDSIFTPESIVDEAQIGDYVSVDFDGYFHAEENYIYRTESLVENLTNPGISLKFKPFIQARNWLITLGNGDILPGLEMAIRFLKLNECGVVKCHSKYAYGPYGRKSFTESNSVIPELPPHANVIFKVKIKNIISQDDEQTKTASFIVKVFNEMKSIGNHYYKYDWVDPDGGSGKVRALKLYNTVCREGTTLLQDLDHGSKERREALFIVVDSFNNISAVYMREKEYRKAKDAAANAIQLDPYNLKALCRAAKAAMMVGEFEECKMALETAEEIADNIDIDDGLNKMHVQKLKREFIKKKREHKQLEKEIYAQMLSGKRDKATKNKIHENKIQSQKHSHLSQREHKETKKEMDSHMLSDKQGQPLRHNITTTMKQSHEKCHQSKLKDIHNNCSNPKRTIINQFVKHLIVPIVATIIWFVQKHLNSER